MNIAITNVRSANTEEWDTIWQGCEYGTYFHSREWAEIWHVYTNGTFSPEPKLIIFSDEKKALLPLSRTINFKGLIKNYISSPAGTFGGWISAAELKLSHGLVLVNYLKRLGNLLWRVNPYDSTIRKIDLNFKFRTAVKEDETQVLDLRKGFDEIYNQWTKGHASAARKARKARKEGVLIREASTLKDWQDYYNVYEDSIRRWGDKVTSFYDWKLFHEMFSRKSPYIKLWLALYQEEVVAGALCFYSKRHVGYWHGAASEKYFNLRPVNLLMYEIINDACERGYHWFDFNPSGGHEGVKAFKKSFGTISLPCPAINIEKKIVKNLRAIKSVIKSIF